MIVAEENVISLPMRGGKTTKAIQCLHDSAVKNPDKTHFYICATQNEVENAKFHYKHLYIQIPDNVKFLTYKELDKLYGHNVGRCCLDEFERAEICSALLKIDDYIKEHVETFFFTSYSCEAITARLSLLRQFRIYLEKIKNDK